MPDLRNRHCTHPGFFFNPLYCHQVANQTLWNLRIGASGGNTGSTVYCFQISWGMNWFGWLLACVLRHISLWRLFNAKSGLFIYILDIYKICNFFFNETQFLPSSGRIDTAIWMHYLDANKTAGEKARRQLHKNAACNIEQVLEVTPHKAPTIRPPTSHHEIYPS